MDAWIKTVEDAISLANLIPLWGAPPVFPFETFSEKLAAVLHVSKVSVDIEKTEWKKPTEFLTGLGQKPSLTVLEFSGLTPPFFWAMAKEDVAKLSSLTLAKTQEKGFTHPDFQEGYLQFVFLEVLGLIEDLGCFSPLCLHIGKEAPLPEENALCYDVKITLQRSVLRSRLICPASQIQNVRGHFSQNKPSLKDSPLAKNAILPVRLEVGSTSLKWQQWESIKTGDLLVLDRCSFDPEQDKGNVTLTLGKVPLFRGRIKDHQIKLLDYAFYYEETMESEGETQEKPEASVEEILSSEEIPLTLTVEVGKLTLSVEKLLEMRPGNLLELDIHPEHGVFLTVEGKRVARGELVKVGELLGVRILECK